MPVKDTEIETYTIDDVIRVPILLRDEEGVGHVRAIFKRSPSGYPRSQGPRSRRHPGAARKRARQTEAVSQSKVL